MTMHRGRIAIALVAASVGAGCESGGDALVHRAELGGEHEVGVSACPQDVGDIEVSLGARAPDAITLAVEDDLLAIDVLDPDFGWPINRGSLLSLAPGESLALRVQFNCGASDDVDGAIVLRALDRDGATIETTSFPIAVRVVGAR